jgi:hypothetical protein
LRQKTIKDTGQMLDSCVSRDNHCKFLFSHSVTLANRVWG